MKTPTFQDTVGFSVQDTLALYWLHSTATDPQYPKELHMRFMETFPGRRVGYVYVARVAARLEQEQSLKSSTVSGKKYYSITELGQKRLKQYRTTYFLRFDEVAAVIARFYFELTKNGTPSSKEFELLHEDFRPFLAKLLSVKDVVRYMALRLSLNRHSFFMAEVEDQLNARFGWAPSNGYLYQIAREMEETGLLVGQWPDERRTIRTLKRTKEGEEFYKVVSQSLTDRITQVRSYLHYILEFLREV